MNPIRAFARERPNPMARPCWACNIPETALINEAYAAKGEDHVSAPEILWVLREKYGHHDATLPRLTNHFGSGHHLRQPA